MRLVSGGRVAIKFNDHISPYFLTFKGVRQGILCPLLFNIIDDGLAPMVKKAQQQGLISSLVPILIDGWLSLLQYADDTIFLLVWQESIDK
jgi:hypothetical protein